MERRFSESQRAVSVEKRADGKATITGYAAVFYDGTAATEYELWNDTYGRAVERILPGAFDGALSRPDDVRGLFNHDANQVLGRTKAGTMRLSVDAVGLKYEIDAADTGTATEVAALIQRGDISGSSFAFSISNAGQRWTSTTDASGKASELREILAVELFDVGPVTFPAYDKTTAGLRAAGDVNEARAARDAWVKANPAKPRPTPRLDEAEIELVRAGI